MAEMCWFCKKNPEDPKRNIEVPIYKVNHQESVRVGGNQVRTTYEYVTGKVNIPRCDKCAEAHIKAKKDDAQSMKIVLIALLVTIVIFFGLLAIMLQIGQAYVWIAIAAGILGFVLSIGWLIAANIKIKNYLKSIGTLPESDHPKYPEFSKMYIDGWLPGISPTGQNPT
jgi:hypothetical protein